MVKPDTSRLPSVAVPVLSVTADRPALAPSRILAVALATGCCDAPVTTRTSSV